MEDQIKEFLSQILEQLGLSFTDMRIDISDETMIRVDLDSEEANRIIGWHGETINSIQHILKSIIRSQQKLDRAPFIVVDVDGYRKNQEQKVIRIAEQKSDFVRKKNTKVALPPMSPYFRRVVHLYVANEPTMQDLTTESVGQGDYRQVILCPKGSGSNINDGEELSPVIEGEGEGPVISEENEDVFADLDV